MEGSSGEPLASGDSSADQYLVHKVSKHDNLAGIAIRYGVTVLDLKQANGLLSDNAMFARDTLVVPLERREVRITDASTVASFVNRLGRRVDHTDFVSRPGTTALGPIASDPRYLEESVTTPTSTAASSESDFRDIYWRDPAEIDMKMVADIAMPSKNKNGYNRRDSMRQRHMSSRSSERPASCSPRMESQADRETGSLWTGERPCSPSCSESSPGLASRRSTTCHSSKRSRPPNLPNGKKASQISDYLICMAHSMVSSSGSGRSSSLTPRESANGRSSETILQRMKRVASQSALGKESVLHLTSIGDSLAASLASLQSRISMNGRTASESGSTHGRAAIPKNGLKSD
eukprot:evm.model.scf_259.4 EVM.evm.TU.scf_259.4   scf_259:28879-33711(+)